MAERAAIVEEWSFRLAEAVSPDEAILAPTMAEAFIAGGRQRAQLFSESSGVLGGFGAGGLILVIPGLLSAIAAVGPLLIAALSSPLTGGLVGALDNCLELLAIREERQKAGHPAAALPPDSDLAPVLKVLDTMQTEMRAKGVSAEASEAAAYRSLRTLFADPSGATQFVRAVAQ